MPIESDDELYQRRLRAAIMAVASDGRSVGYSLARKTQIAQTAAHFRKPEAFSGLTMELFNLAREAVAKIVRERE